MLYDNIMLNIFDIFTSKARVKVLRTLAFQVEAMPLRLIASVSDLPVFSVQNALNSLCLDGVVIRTAKENNVLFELNKTSDMYELLMQFFILEANYQISREAKKNFQKAARVLAFASSAGAIFQSAKKRGR